MGIHDPHTQDGAVAAALAAGLAALLAVTVVGFLLVGDADPPAGGGVPAATYRDVVLGVDREALIERMLPERPVDVEVLERSSAGPPDAACVLYRAADRSDGMYRFCFEDDRLVAKSVLPTG